MQRFCKKNKNILISIGINVVLVLLAIFVFGTRYATDDDLSIARIAYGTFFNAQSRVVFSGTAFGTLLKVLSNIAPRLNWQLIVYYVVLLFGGVVSLVFVLKKGNRRLTILWLLIVAVFYNSVYVDINFSLISGMLAFYGYATLFLGAYEKEKQAIGLSIIPLSFSMTIRYDSFLGISVFAFFAFVLIVFETIKKGEEFSGVFNKFFVPFIIGLSLPMILFVSDKLAYTSDSWAEYIEYNDNRAQILDFHSVLKGENQAYFDELGLTEEMVKSINNWQFNDPEIFDREVIAKLSADSKKLFPPISIDFFFEALGYCVEKTGKLYYFLFAIVTILFLTVKKDVSSKAKICVYLLPWIIVIPYLVELGAFYYLDRGIDRVFRTVGLGLWIGIFALLATDSFEEDARENKGYKPYIVGCIAMIVLSFVCQIKDLKDIRGFYVANIEQSDKDLEFLQDGRVYMCDIGSLREIEDSYGVWHIPAKNSLYNCVELGGWLINYPEMIKKQEALGVSNPYRSLAYNENAYLLSTEDGQMQLDYLRSAYDENISYELVEKHRDVYIYKYKVK